MWPERASTRARGDSAPRSVTGPLAPTGNTPWVRSDRASELRPRHGIIRDDRWIRAEAIDRGPGEAANASTVAPRRRAGAVVPHPPTTASPRREIAVALHGVEPATYERCALIRDWLDDHGIDRVTLLVIPASDLHPFSDRRPEMVDWLLDRVDGGDSVAQHGFQHRRPGRVARTTRHSYRVRTGGAEFVGLDEAETKRAVDSGRRLLRLAGLQPRGFVAPAYGYTSALHRVLATSFEWWACSGGLSCAGGGHTVRSPALRLGTTTPLQRLASPAAVRAGARMAGPLLRLDLHPADLDHTGHMRAVESVLRRANDRRARTYDELALEPTSV